MEVRKIPDKAVSFITMLEGFRGSIYLDIVGKKTIGYGHLLKPGEEFLGGISHGEAIELLRKDLLYSAASIKRLIRVPLTDDQYSALLSFVFNLGGGITKKHSKKHAQ